MVDSIRPPEQYNHHAWHWLETSVGNVCASWYPHADDGKWDISGHTFRYDDPAFCRRTVYIGPAIPRAPRKHSDMPRMEVDRERRG